jgi:hypothetical protein
MAAWQAAIQSVMICGDHPICDLRQGLSIVAEGDMRKLITLISAMNIFLFDVTQALSCADGLFCAVVRSTRDGFVALRDRPGASSRLIYKLKPYQIVVIVSSDCTPNRDSDPWTEVECVPEVEGGCDSKMKTISGWVNSKLLAHAHCPKGMN